VTQGIEHGHVTEAFAAGTAAIITPVGAIGWAGKDFVLNNNQVGPVTRKMYETLTGCHFGTSADPYGWMHVVESCLA
jgi:branched-chain amino acid aminotransferase